MCPVGGKAVLSELSAFPGHEIEKIFRRVGIAVWQIGVRTDDMPNYLSYRW
jgi:hypothetical protein